jgi:tetratricopeptide (TPR) repeat protein
MSFFRLLALLLLLCGSSLHADESRTHPLIADGVRLHDAGDFAGAIEQYQAAMDAGADTVLARYEMALSYLALDDKPAALAIAEQAAEEDHRLRPTLYMIIGSILDQTGDSDAAIATFEKAIELEPDSFLLHFNLGVTHLGREEWDRAREGFERALALNPDHVSSHLFLGMALGSLNQRMSAVVAYTRFLMLEPNTKRSEVATQRIDELFLTGYSKDPASGNVELTISQVPENTELGAADFAMSIAQAAAESSEGAAGTAPIKRLESAIAIFTEVIKPETQGFSASFYGPYFQALHSRDLLEAACYFALQNRSHAAVDWLNAHPDQIEALRTLTAEHDWTN